MGQRRRDMKERRGRDGLILREETGSKRRRERRRDVRFWCTGVCQKHQSLATLPHSLELTDKQKYQPARASRRATHTHTHARTLTRTRTFTHSHTHTHAPHAGRRGGGRRQKGRRGRSCREKRRRGDGDRKSNGLGKGGHRKGVRGEVPGLQHE